MTYSLKDAAVKAALSEAAVAFPVTGAMRVHIRPDSLYRPVPSSDGSPQPSGPNRFDDPNHRYPVRYLGENLRVCLLEVLARFRANGEADALLEQMTPGLDDPGLADLVDPEPAEGVRDFLATNKIATFTLTHQHARKLVDVFHPGLLSALDGHHGVRDKLAGPAIVGAYGDDQGRVDLDGSLIRNANRKVGRPVTQYISWLLFEVLHVRALRYYSRHSEGQESLCWAVHGDVAVKQVSLESLDPADPAHLDAVQYVAQRYALMLPPVWSQPPLSGCA